MARGSRGKRPRGAARGRGAAGGRLGAVPGGEVLRGDALQPVAPERVLPRGSAGE